MAMPMIGKKFAAKLLSKALNDGYIQRYDDWNSFILPLTESYRIKYYNLYRKKLQQCGFDDHILLSNYLIHLYPENFSHIICSDDGIPEWNIFGCPHTGKDYDIIVKITDAQLPLYPGDEEYLIKCFHNSELYDTRKELDICYISNKDGSYQTNHGGAETLNICYHSYNWHKQAHPQFFNITHLVPIQVSDKLISLSKFIMDKAEIMLSSEKYRDIRQEKKISYNNGETRFEFTFKLLELFSMDPELENWNPGFWKSFVMKLTQAFLCSKYSDYHKNQYPYDKIQLANKFSESFPEWFDEIRNVLLYNFQKANADFKIFLIDLYRELYIIHYPRFSNELIKVNTKINSSSVSDDVFRAFINYPKYMTHNFYKLWKRNYGEDKNISKQFVEPCCNMEMFVQYPSLIDRILTLPQRSPEWHDAYNNKFITGRSNGLKNIPNDCSSEQRLSLLYNLIMGCIGEQMIHETLLKEKLNIIGECNIATVGMIVEGLVGSRAFCPDAVGKLPNGLLFPIEYKTIYSEIGPCNNNVFMREFNLARNQLRGAVNVINCDSVKPLSTFGLAIFMFIYPSNKDSNKYNFELRWNKILFSEDELYFTE